MVSTSVVSRALLDISNELHELLERILHRRRWLDSFSLFEATDLLVGSQYVTLFDGLFDRRPRIVFQSVIRYVAEPFSSLLDIFWRRDSAILLSIFTKFWEGAGRWRPRESSDSGADGEDAVTFCKAIRSAAMSLRSSSVNLTAAECTFEAILRPCTRSVRNFCRRIPRSC